MFIFYTACSKPPALTDGNYDADLSDKYTKGDIVQFTCDEETLTHPSTSTIECGESGWMENATCTRSWLSILPYSYFHKDSKIIIQLHVSIFKGIKSMETFFL